MIMPLPVSRPAPAPYRVDISRGSNISRVCSEWFSRPDDERFLSLDTLYAKVRTRAEAATTRIIESGSLRIEARSDDSEHLLLYAPGDPGPIAPTHRSFGQLCSRGGGASILFTGLVLTDHPFFMAPME